MKTKDLALTALMAALICVCSPLSVNVGPIPISLCTLAVYLSAAVLGSKRGTLAVAVFLLIGVIGLPVFSGFTGGFQKLAGVTGGYLIGYMPCAWITGLGAQPGVAGRWRLPLMAVLGTAALYALGTAWFMAQSGNGPGASLALCVLPFLPGDAVKIAAVSMLAKQVKKAVKTA